MYRLDKEGNVLDRDISIAVDGFVMSGLAEYFVATNNEDALQLALATQQTIAARLATPGSYGLAPYPLPAGMKNLGVAMLYSLYFFDLGQIAGRDDLAQQGLELAHEVLNDFYVPQKDALLEFVSCSGEFVESPEGRTCIPGHGLEALWFLISVFERTGDKERIVRCCRLIRRHLELAWDEEFGGLQLAIDIDGRKPVHWQKPECKPWWVQVEALVATAYAYRHSGDPWCLEWHEKVSRWAYAHYPVPTGEWTQWLDRQGNKTQSAALPLKDPFHLPRALVCLIDVFGDIEQPEADEGVRAVHWQTPVTLRVKRRRK
jgi:N-acylglucosamine 2-epimerase